MSALAARFNRKGPPPDHQGIARMLTPQRLHNADSENVYLSRNVGLGCRSFWTTPEERGETQPLVLPGIPYAIAWDGRVDNREELTGLVKDDTDPRTCSDAELVLRLIALKGEEILTRLLGSFAFIFYDISDQRMLLARDPIGQRNLSYYLDEHTLLVASEECGILACPEVTPRLNTNQMACFFSLMNLEQGATYYSGIVKLLPGHWLWVDAARTTLTRYWQPDLGHRIRYRDERDYAAHYRELLEQSVSCRTRTGSGMGVMTSGGLDSGPVAALAARRRPVNAYTWTFERFPDCNEGDYVTQLCNLWDCRLQEVYCDDCAPYSDFEHWPVHPDTPDQDPYRRFLDATYRRAADTGDRVLLNGSGGDNLYVAADLRVWQLLRLGRFDAVLRGAHWYIQHRGLQSFLRRVLIRGLVPRALLTALRPTPRPEWLTAHALTLLPSPADRWPPGYQQAARPLQALSCLSLRMGDFIAAESRWSNALGIEVRYPMRDRRIIEFMLALPDDQLLFRDLSRPVLRRAVSDLLPPAQLERRDKTSFDPVFDHGRNKARHQIDRLLRDRDCIWNKYVRADWVSGDAASTQTIAKTLEWTVVSTELWRNRRDQLKGQQSHKRERQADQ